MLEFQDWINKNIKLIHNDKDEVIRFIPTEYQIAYFKSGFKVVKDSRSGGKTTMLALYALWAVLIGMRVQVKFRKVADLDSFVRLVKKIDSLNDLRTDASKFGKIKYCDGIIDLQTDLLEKQKWNQTVKKKEYEVTLNDI